MLGLKPLCSVVVLIVVNGFEWVDGVIGLAEFGSLGM